MVDVQINGTIQTLVIEHMEPLTVCSRGWVSSCHFKLVVKAGNSLGTNVCMQTKCMMVTYSLSLHHYVLLTDFVDTDLGLIVSTCIVACCCRRS